MLNPIKRGLSLVLLLVSIIMLGWAALPNQQESYTQSISSADLISLNGEMGGSPVRVNPRRVTLEWPGKLRIGGQDEITLKFEPVNDDGSASTLQPVAENIYDRYSLMAEGRFEVAGVRVEPANPIRESMPAGHAVEFTWQISSDKAGVYDGAVWLSLRLLPLDGSSAIQVPIFIKEMKVQTSSLLGLNVSMTLILGGVGMVFSGLLGFKEMVDLMQREKAKKIS